jgi:hypothetical protein
VQDLCNQGVTEQHDPTISIVVPVSPIQSSIMTDKIDFYSIDIMRVCSKEKILMKCGVQLIEAYAKRMMATRINRDMKSIMDVLCHLMHKMVDIINIEQLLRIHYQHIVLMSINRVAREMNNCPWNSVCSTIFNLNARQDEGQGITKKVCHTLVELSLERRNSGVEVEGGRNVRGGARRVGMHPLAVHTLNRGRSERGVM